MYYYKKSFSKTAKKEYAEKMDLIGDFCKVNNISHSALNDSYYFRLNGIDYRISNHTIAASNKAAYDWLGNQIRPEYHQGGEDADTVYITASKTRPN